MANVPLQPEPVPSQALDQEAERDQAPMSTPGWVIVVLAVLLILIVLFIIRHLVGYGVGHQMHMSMIDLWEYHR